MSITSLRVGTEVMWIPDGEEGVVIRVLEDHQAVCIRWESGKDCWYSAWSGSLLNIEVIGHNKEAA